MNWCYCGTLVNPLEIDEDIVMEDCDAVTDGNPNFAGGNSLFNNRWTGLMHNPNPVSNKDFTLMPDPSFFSDLKSCCDLNTDEFCLRMANHVLLKELHKGTNSLLSPLSFQLILSLVAAGSSGHTLEKLLSALGSQSLQALNSSSSRIISLLSSTATGGPIFSCANGIWVDQNFNLKPSFQHTATSIYGAEAKAVDFVYKAEQVRIEVNSWAENATRGLIKDLLPQKSLDSNTTLVLANALYFKGAWEKNFHKSFHDYFHLLNGQTIQAPFVADNYSVQFYGSFDGFQAVKIPYQNGQGTTTKFSMYIFLPNETHGLMNLVHKFRSYPRCKFELCKESLERFWIPKFNFSFQFDALDTMLELGLDFENLGEMVTSPIKLQVTNVLHKSFVQVNEQGTEAAASTAVLVCSGSTSGPPPKPRDSFVADHPFMFMIMEETSGIVFFTGLVLNPLL